MRIAFIDHSSHERTGSSRFARELVARLGETTVLIAPADGSAADDPVVEAFVSGAFDRWVFWQTDNIATRLVPLGLRGAVLVPMLERVHAAPDAYFHQFVLSRFAVFTRALHRRLQALGCRSAAFTYRPEPEPAPMTERAADQAALSAYFWERQPHEVPHGPSVIAQCRALGIPRLHIHLTPDGAGGERRSDDLAALGRQEGIAVTTSTGLADPEAARALARSTQFVFASRPYEGLGLSILEAMAAGQVVIAPDLPVANECIGHLSSGILYPLESPLDLPRLAAERVAALSAGARARATTGRAHWIADVERFQSYVLGDDRRWSAGEDSALFLNTLRRRAHERTIFGEAK